MLHIDERNASPIYDQIVQQVKALIAKNILQEGDRIPSVRELSAALLVNPNTVSKAYQELERQGIIVTAKGKGAFVAKPASSPGMEKERTESLRSELKRLAVEARHLGVPRRQFREWIEAEITEYWGDSDA